MNKVLLIGRLTKDPDVRYSGETAVARYTLAVDRRTKERDADFIGCVAFGKAGEFAEKYLRKGMRIAVEGRIQTGSYEKDGRRFYTTDVVAEQHEFCESKGTAPQSAPQKTDTDWSMAIPDGIDEELPFN